MENLANEAIAVARELREGALANAKAMLHEAFMPKLEKMIEETLSVEEDGRWYDIGDADIENTPATLTDLKPK